MSPTRKYSIAATLFGVIATVFLFVIQLTLINGFWMLIRVNVGFWLTLILVAVSVVGGMAAWNRGHNTSRDFKNHGYDRYGYARREVKPTPKKARFEVPFWAFATFGSATFLLGVFLLFYVPYAKAVQVNGQNKIVKPTGGIAALDNYKNRAPFVIAKQQTVDNTTINGSPEDTTYIPELDKFGAPVIKKGILQGYGQVVWQSIGTTGQAKVTPCFFSADASRRLGGTFSHNLERLIIRKDFAVQIDSGDSYAYCAENGEPIVVAPFTKYKGFLFPVEVPAGVATYNGKSGEVKIYRDVKSGEIPGPAYPISLAEQARRATPAGDGFWSWIQKKTGFNEYGGENSSDYTLRKADNSGDSFVTPLAMKGRGRAITAVGEVSSNEFIYGKLNTYKIAMLPEPRQGNSAVNDRVKSDYGDLNWASGLEIFEITPTGPTKWAATIGLRKSIVYRLEINADGSSCLFSVKGDKLRCTEDGSIGIPTTATPNSDDPLDLASMTDKQLIELQRRVTSEVAKRLGPTPVK